MKLKAASQEKGLEKWKEYYKNLLGNPPEITDNLFEKIIYSQIDIKLGHYIRKTYLAIQSIYLKIMKINKK